MCQRVLEILDAIEFLDNMDHRCFFGYGRSRDDVVHSFDDSLIAIAVGRGWAIEGREECTIQVVCPVFIKEVDNENHKLSSKCESLKGQEMWIVLAFGRKLGENKEQTGNMDGACYFLYHACLQDKKPPESKIEVYVSTTNGGREVSFCRGRPAVKLEPQDLAPIELHSGYRTAFGAFEAKES